MGSLDCDCEFQSRRAQSGESCGECQDEKGKRNVTDKFPYLDVLAFFCCHCRCSLVCSVSSPLLCLVLLVSMNDSWQVLNDIKCPCLNGFACLASFVLCFVCLISSCSFLWTRSDNYCNKKINPPRSDIKKKGCEFQLFLAFCSVFYTFYSLLCSECFLVWLMVVPYLNDSWQILNHIIVPSFNFFFVSIGMD